MKRFESEAGTVEVLCLIRSERFFEVAELFKGHRSNIQQREASELYIRVLKSREVEVKSLEIGHSDLPVVAKEFMHVVHGERGNAGVNVVVQELGELSSEEDAEDVTNLDAPRRAREAEVSRVVDLANRQLTLGEDQR